jgi:hypothetical protein
MRGVSIWSVAAVDAWTTYYVKCSKIVDFIVFPRFNIIQKFWRNLDMIAWDQRVSPLCRKS